MHTYSQNGEMDKDFRKPGVFMKSAKYHPWGDIQRRLFCDIDGVWKGRE